MSKQDLRDYALVLSRKGVPRVQLQIGEDKAGQQNGLSEARTQEWALKGTGTSPQEEG